VVAGSQAAIRGPGRRRAAALSKLATMRKGKVEVVSGFKALIFDVDGTLADTERDGHRVAFNLAFADAGLDWYWDVPTYGRLLYTTGGKERLRHFIEHDLREFIAPTGLDGFVNEIHAAKNRHYTALLKSGAIPLRPGVERLLKEARESGLGLGIATTTSPENITTLLGVTLGEESIAWFNAIAAGDIVPHKKPASDVYEYALEQLGLPAESCLAIEDSENGILSSLGAGLKTIVTVNPYTRDQDFSGALIVLDQLGEPSTPFRVLAGDAGDSNYVDIAMLRRFQEEDQPSLPIR